MKPKDENKVCNIFQSTLKLVEAHGLAGTTMQAVAKEAELATGTLYIYFQNKEALIVELFDRCIKNSAKDYFNNYDEAKPFKIGFKTIWHNITQHRLENFEETVFIEQCFHCPFIDKQTKMEQKKTFDPLVKLMERGKAEYLVKQIDTFWLLSFLNGNINEVVKKAHYFDIELTDQVLEDNFLLCWDGLKA